MEPVQEAMTEVQDGAVCNLDTTGLCLLSLDGGGVRGLSSLYILKGLMTRLNDERKASGLPKVKPCEIFDLIGGTSTGGLVAIMLGRLEMDVDECIDAYRTLMETIFEKKRSGFSVTLTGKIKARFSSKALEAAVKQVISGRGGVSVDEPFHNEAGPDDDRNCKVFVCANAKETNNITRLRSYRLPGGFNDNPKIWEAALATSAAPTFFDPVQIGVRKYVDGAIGANNPVNQVEDEASNIWCEETGRLEPLVKCFISIGTGEPDIQAIQDKSWKFLTESIVRVATETRETNERFTGRWRAHLDTRYFRFNVENGLQKIGLAEYMEEASIEARTRLYLDGHGVQRKVKTCVQNLRYKRYRPNSNFCLERARSQDRKDQAERNQREGGQNAPVHITATEICNQITKDDLLQAQENFQQALRGLTFQTPPAKPKEFAKVYQKLMSTFLRLSHLLTFTDDERMGCIREADRCGRLAMDNAVRSQNAGRVAQMRFYLACVKAREVCLISEVDELTGMAYSRRDEALEGMSAALSGLETIEDLDMASYEAMAREYNQHLMQIA